MEKTLHNGTTLKFTTSDYFKAGAEFQRYCTAKGIPQYVSLAMFIIGDRIRPHYYATDEAAIEVAKSGFARFPDNAVIEL